MEKVVANKQLRLAVETEEERRARLENDAATKWLRLAMETDEERKARLEKMVATTQLRLALETEGERRAKKKRFGLRLEFFSSRNELTRPVIGNHYSSIYIRVALYVGLTGTFHRIDRDVSEGSTNVYRDGHAPFPIFFCCCCELLQ